MTGLGRGLSLYSLLVGISIIIPVLRSAFPSMGGIH